MIHRKGPPPSRESPGQAPSDSGEPDVEPLERTDERSAPVSASPPSLKLLRRPRFVPSQRAIAGRYRVSATIGTGGMGTVYSAVDLHTGAEVAVKFLKAQFLSATDLRRFRREAQTALTVKHRHLCNVHYLGVDQGTPYIVMELLAGETLRRRIADTGPLSPADAVTVMIQVLEGLSAAHAMRVIHRDIKPGNIFVTTPRGSPPSVKVIDFGLAKLIAPGAMKPRATTSDGEDTAITSTDVTPGTPFYMSPEQVAGVRDLDERVDVWAAGLTLYELLLGRRPYDALAQSLVSAPLPPLSSVRADLPVGFDAVLAKALQKRREDRYASAAEFRTALVELWARHRTAGVARGERLRKFRPEAKTIPCVEELAEGEEATELDISIEFDPTP